MNPPAANLVPPLDSFGIPADAWIFVFLMNLTLVLHFLLLGYVFTVTLLGIFWSAAPEGSAARWMLRATERPLPVALSFAITLGVAPLLFVQVLYHSFFYTANIIIGYQWIGIIPVLILAFYLIYVLQGGVFLGRPIPRLAEFAGRLVIFLCILYTGLTHTANALLALHPDRWEAARAAGGSPLFMAGLPAFWPRLAHNLLALVIVGSFWLINMGWIRARRMADEAVRDPSNSAFLIPHSAFPRAMARLAGALAFVAILAEFGVGLWLLLAESPPIIQKALFGPRPASIFWMASLGLGALLWIVAALAALAAPPRWVLHASGSVLLLTLGGMFAGREAVRQAWLAPYFKMAHWTVNWQYSSLALFLAAFVAALVLVALMAWWLRQAFVKSPA